MKNGIIEVAFFHAKAIGSNLNSTLFMQVTNLTIHVYLHFQVVNTLNLLFIYKIRHVNTTHYSFNVTMMLQSIIMRGKHSRTIFQEVKETPKY